MVVLGRSVPQTPTNTPNLTPGSSPPPGRRGPFAPAGRSPLGAQQAQQVQQQQAAAAPPAPLPSHVLGPAPPAVPMASAKVGGEVCRSCCV